MTQIHVQYKGQQNLFWWQNVCEEPQRDSMWKEMAPLILRIWHTVSDFEMRNESEQAETHRHTDRHLREKHKSAVSPGLIPPPSVPSCSPHPFPVPANDCSAHYTQTNTHTHSHTALMLESLDSIFTSVWDSITADNQIAYKLIRHWIKQSNKTLKTTVFFKQNIFSDMTVFT